MKRSLAILTALMLTASPLSADDSKSPLPSDEEMQQLGDIAQRWMRSFKEKMSPMVEQLREMVDDMSAYEAPEMLPNGDIIIRRKPDAETAEDEAPSIEL